MIGIVVTLAIALTVLLHGVRTGRNTRAAERRDDLAVIDRARTEVSFLDVVDGWFILPERSVPVICDLHRLLSAELTLGGRTAAAKHARDLLQLLAPYHRVDIVDA